MSAKRTDTFTRLGSSKLEKEGVFIPVCCRLYELWLTSNREFLWTIEAQKNMPDIV